MENVGFRFNFHIKYDHTSIEEVLRPCEEAIDKITSCKEVEFKLKFALQELIVNSIEHGYQKTEGEVSVLISKNENLITLEICDNGIGINVPGINLDRVVSRLEDAGSRGWGLSIIKELSDSLVIESNDTTGIRVVLTLHD